MQERSEGMKKLLAIVSGLVLLLNLARPAAADRTIVIGAECDRTGPTQVVGINLCPGFYDYIKLVNSKGA
jgi:branched-chain amino acid transport system substrate-binding protein